MERRPQARIAVLIDAENAQTRHLPPLLTKLANIGISSVKRAYGDWTSTRLTGWKRLLNEHAVQPIQQFGYTAGKNSTDSALIIDAMDLLHTGRFQGFCIVSSDSDFTRLATRLRESGMQVYGVGEQKTPQAFVSACDTFIYTESLAVAQASNGRKVIATQAVTITQASPSVASAPKTRNLPAKVTQPGISVAKASTAAVTTQTVPKSVPDRAKTPQATTAKAPPKTPDIRPQATRPQAKDLRANTKLVDLLRAATRSAKTADGWAPLGTVGQHLAKYAPDFDPRKYGYAKLGSLMTATNLFEITARSTPAGKQQIYIRDTSGKST